jgi:hypothetical protein
MGGSLPVEKIVERLDWVVDDSFQCDVQPQGKNVYKTQFPNKMAEEEESREAASCVTYDRAPVVFFSSVGATHLAGRALQLDRETSVLLPQQGVRFRLRKSGMGLTRPFTRLVPSGGFMSRSLSSRSCARLLPQMFCASRLGLRLHVSIGQSDGVGRLALRLFLYSFVFLLRT